MKKTFLFCLFCIFSVFVNLESVGAADSCTCYYNGYLHTEDNGSTYQTNYLVSIQFNKSDFDAVENKEEYEPQISFFGERGYNTVTDESGRIQDGTSQAVWFSRWWQNGAGLDGNGVKSLFDNDCSCDNLGQLTFISQNYTKELLYNFDDHYHTFFKDFPIFDFERADLFLMTKEQFDEQRNSENVAETAEDQGFSASVDPKAIINWAQHHGYDVSIDSIGDPCQIIDGSLKKILTSAFWIISIAGIVLLVVMTAISFIKAIVGSDDEKLRDAISHLFTRIIVVIILLLLPMLLSFIITLINNTVGDGKVSIGSDGNVFCDVNGVNSGE